METNANQPSNSYQSTNNSGNNMIYISSSEELKNILNGEGFEKNELCPEEDKNSEENKSINEDSVRNHMYVLQFSAEWCGLCKSIQPLVQVSFDKS